MPSTELLQQVIALIDKANGADPNQVSDSSGKEWPKELLYSQRMTDMLNRFVPDADAVAHIAMRGQHIERWKSPRSAFSMDRKGYMRWRTELYKFHAETTAKIMTDVGFDQTQIGRVEMAVSKRGIKSNADTQLLEDVTDLVFLEHYLLDFANKHPEYDEEKWLDILRKTWRKMSTTAQEFALGGNIELPESLLPLIKKAVAG